MNSRHRGLPILVLIDAESQGVRAVNGLHVQTFVPNVFGDKVGTLITFANGDSVTVTDSFDTVVKLFMGDRHDG